MELRRRRTMARLRDHSLTTEKRLQRRYPSKYPTMHSTSIGCVACDAAEDDAFTRWLMHASAAEKLAEDATT